MTTARRFPVFSSIAGGALLASALLASALSAQERPPQPPRRSGRMGDSLPPRPERVNPDMQGMRGMPGAPGARPDMMPGMMPRMRDMQGMQDMQRGPGGPRTSVAGLLGMRQQLGLTDDQVRRIEAIRSNMTAPRNESEMMRAQADLMEATRGDVNMNAARAALERINRIRLDEELAGLKARQDMRNVLTPEQKSRLDAMRQNGFDAMPGGRGMTRRMRQGAGPGNMPGMGQGLQPGVGQGMRPGMRPGMRRELRAGIARNPRVRQNTRQGIRGGVGPAQLRPGSAPRGLAPDVRAGSARIVGPGMGPGMRQGTGPEPRPGMRPGMRRELRDDIRRDVQRDVRRELQRDMQRNMRKDMRKGMRKDMRRDMTRGRRDDADRGVFLRRDARAPQRPALQRRMRERARDRFDDRGMGRDRRPEIRERVIVPPAPPRPPEPPRVRRSDDDR